MLSNDFKLLFLRLSIAFVVINVLLFFGVLWNVALTGASITYNQFFAALGAAGLPAAALFLWYVGSDEV